MPGDLNKANQRVMALDTLYEFDLTADQLNELKAACAATASQESPPAVKGIPKLSSTLKSLQDAILAGADDQRIATLRNQVADIVSASDKIDDNIDPTDAALAKAPEACRLLKASQIAAFLAAHADEVSDPVEKMVGVVDQLRESSDSEAEGIIQATSSEVALLVGGLDDVKSKTVADRVSQWLKASRVGKDNLTPEQHASYAESARRIVGDVPAMEVLEHWLQSQMAILLSNPQLPKAIDELKTARENS